MFHKHQWKVLSEHKEPSPAEKAGPGWEGSGIPFEFYQGKLVTLVTCDKCGKIEKFVTKI